MLSSTNYAGLANISSRINETVKTINRNGLENTTENLFHKLKNNDIQHLKNTELKGINAAERQYQHYNDVFKSMKTAITSFKEKISSKLNATHDPVSTQALNKELSGLLSTIKQLSDVKVDGDKLFGHYTELFIGDGLRTPRTFDRSYIEINGTKIEDKLQALIDNPSPDLNVVDEVSDFLNIKHSEIGARWSGVESTKAIYENTMLVENDFMSKRNQLVENYQKLNDLTLSYEALSKVIAKVSALSLVNYV